MRKLPFIVAVLVLASLACGCNNPSQGVPTAIMTTKDSDASVKVAIGRLEQNSVVQGTISKLIYANPATPEIPAMFLITDPHGDNIWVLPSEALGLPAASVTYRMLGHATEDPRNPGKKVFIEIQRVRWDPVKDAPMGEPGQLVAGPRLSPLAIALLAATAIVLVVLLVVLFATLLGGRGSSGETVTVEGGTIKMQVGSKQAVTAGTVKVLPGRFEVLSGDEQMKEIRLFLTRDNPAREYTIGRIDPNSALATNHIGFKAHTVSANQGKLLCSQDGHYTIINYADPATKNPIVVNGQPLGLGESRPLSDNDTIEIGTVQLQYHAA